MINKEFIADWIIKAQKIAHIGIWSRDSETGDMWWSDGVYTILGLEPQSTNPTFEAFVQLVHPDDRASFVKQAEKSLQADEVPHAIDYRIIRPDKSERMVHEEALVELDDTGKAAKITGIIQDTTDSKLAEEALKNSEREYHSLFNQMFSGFALQEIICDPKGKPINYRFLKVNPAYEKLTGLRADELIGKTVLDVLPKTEPHWIDTYGRVALTGEPIIFQNYSADLDKHLEVTAYSPGENQFASIILDISAGKKAEEQNSDLETLLQRAQKIESISTLAGGLAHNFNNILGIILGYTEMAMDDCPAESIMAKDLSNVLDAAYRAKGLVRQIITFSKQGNVECIPLKPAAIIDEAIKMLRPTLPATIKINQDLDERTSFIFADPTQISQILTNLCSNAIYALQEKGGMVDVLLREKYLSSKDLLHEPDVEAGDFVKLTVRDSGPGITSANMERVFDPYFSTKEIGEGTGMGLSIVHGIVKNYGGFISFHSELDKGTTFEVYLPVITEDVILDNDAIEQIPTGKEKILFVDDEVPLAEMGKDMLERLGYDVITKNNSLEALDTFTNNPDQFDLVITDQTMPDMTGADLARRMLQIRPDIPIILCTGYSATISRKEADFIGIREFALKPLSKKEIATLIRKALTD